MLNDHSIGPQNGGKPEYLVIFLHGFFSCGEDTARPREQLLAPLLQTARMVFPDAPIELKEGHRSWFDINDLLRQNFNDIDKKDMAGRAAAAAPQVNEYIDQVMAREGVTADRVIIAGFSQGATMALYAALSRETPVAGVFCLSGGALDCIENPKSKPALFFAAGDYEQDAFSGWKHMVAAADSLKNSGFQVEHAIIPNHAHTFSGDAINLLCSFVERLKKEAAPKQDNKRASSPRRSRPGF